MVSTVDLSVLELVCSRLCHDLVGPVGAATNGIELLREVSGNQHADILDLTDDSARTAWRRLEFFRVAFGHGGGDKGWSESELGALASGMLKDTRVRLDWPQAGIGQIIAGRGGKLILNLVFLIAEALPRGGIVHVAMQTGQDRLQITVEGRGQGATLHPRIAATLTGEAQAVDLDGRMILAYLARQQAEAVGAAVKWGFEQDRVRADIALPRQ